MTDEPNPRTRSPFHAIGAIDYTVIFVRDMAAMRRFYEDVLAFPLLRELSPNWIEYGLGSNTLALARPSRTAADAGEQRFAATGLQGVRDRGRSMCR
jgi:catechol 2,3-dioxygenase-like lactoylglutathione lyase family enzyme